MPKVVAEKRDWIKLGFELFANHGEAGIIVDKMVAKLKCNRSSFYWHFKSKKGFIREIVDYWMDFDTEAIIALTEKSQSPKVKLKSLVATVFHKDPQMDFVFYLKRYAQKDDTIRDLIDQVDQRRMKYVSDIFQELGYSKKDAELKASIFYKYLIGYHEMIRYRNQPKDYVKIVFDELTHFIKI
ncbi:MAG: hypothetical protein Tsb0034_24380 [Ekhidna sp.]